MTQLPPPPRSRTMGAGVGLIAVVAVGTLLAVLFRGGGGSGTGGTGGAGAGPGAGTGAAATQSLAATQPSRPIKIRIDGSSYVVDGRSLDLAGVTDLAAKVPPGEGAAVIVERPGTSRAKAEEDLFAALDKRGVKYVKD